MATTTRTTGVPASERMQPLRRTMTRIGRGTRPIRRLSDAGRAPRGDDRRGFTERPWTPTFTIRG